MSLLQPQPTSSDANRVRAAAQRLVRVVLEASPVSLEDLAIVLGAAPLDATDIDSIVANELQPPPAGNEDANELSDAFEAQATIATVRGNEMPSGLWWKILCYLNIPELGKCVFVSKEISSIAQEVRRVYTKFTETTHCFQGVLAGGYDSFEQYVTANAIDPEGLRVLQPEDYEFVPAKESPNPFYEVIFKAQVVVYPILNNTDIRIYGTLKIEKHKRTGKRRLLIRDTGTGGLLAETTLLHGVQFVESTQLSARANKPRHIVTIRAFKGHTLQIMRIVQDSLIEHEKLCNQLTNIPYPTSNETDNESFDDDHDL